VLTAGAMRNAERALIAIVLMAGVSAPRPRRVVRSTCRPVRWAAPWSRSAVRRGSASASPIRGSRRCRCGGCAASSRYGRRCRNCSTARRPASSASAPIAGASSGAACRRAHGPARAVLRPAVLTVEEPPPADIIVTGNSARLRSPIIRERFHYQDGRSARGCRRARHGRDRPAAAGRGIDAFRPRPQQAVHPRHRRFQLHGPPRRPSASIWARPGSTTTRRIRISGSTTSRRSRCCKGRRARSTAPVRWAA
jgi:hypothetical protein